MNYWPWFLNPDRFRQSTFLAWPTHPVRSLSSESIVPTITFLMHVFKLLVPISIDPTFLMANQTISWEPVPLFVPRLLSVFLKNTSVRNQYWLIRFSSRYMYFVPRADQKPSKSKVQTWSTLNNLLKLFGRGNKVTSISISIIVEVSHLILLLFI